MKKRKEYGAVDGQVGGKKSAGSPGRPPEAQGEYQRTCKSGVQERAPEAQGERRGSRKNRGWEGVVTQGE